MSVLKGGMELISRQRPLFLVESGDRHKPGTVAAVHDFFGGPDHNGFFLCHGRTRDVRELTPGMADTAELLRPVDRYEMRYVSNVFFAPSFVDYARIRSTIDAALMAPAV